MVNIWRKVLRALCLLLSKQYQYIALSIPSRDKEETVVFRISRLPRTLVICISIERERECECCKNETPKQPPSVKKKKEIYKPTSNKRKTPVAALYLPNATNDPHSLSSSTFPTSPSYLPMSPGPLRRGTPPPSSPVVSGRLPRSPTSHR